MTHPDDAPLTIELATPFGVLALTFTDDEPTEEARNSFRRGHSGTTEPERGTVALLHGEIVVNRIPLSIHERFKWAQGYEYPKGGDRIDTGRRALVVDGQSSYNRRLRELGGASTGAWDWQAGYAEKVRKVLPPLVQAAVEAHPELVIAARDAGKASRVARLYKTVQELETQAGKVRAEAQAMSATPIYAKIDGNAAGAK